MVSPNLTASAWIDHTQISSAKEMGKSGVIVNLFSIYTEDLGVYDVCGQEDDTIR